MPEVKFEDLLGSGAHFGHVTRKWNPNFKQFIVAKKNGIHIININHRTTTQIYFYSNRIPIF